MVNPNNVMSVVESSQFFPYSQAWLDVLLIETKHKKPFPEGKGILLYFGLRCKVVFSRGRTLSNA
jgi:hypothetical protein